MPYADPEKQRAYQREWKARRRASWIKEHGPCAGCGSTKRLEVHHVDPKSKIDHKVWTWNKVRRTKELKKCQVLCFTCHRRKTREARPPLQHGTHSRYVKGCRCRACKKAHAETNARYR